MNKRVKKSLFDLLYACVLTAIIFGGWAIAAAAIGSEYILPDIAVTFSALGTLISGKAFWLGLLGTLLRSLIGYAVSLALFFIAFFFATAFEAARRVLDMLVAAMRTLPTMAVALVVAIWAGANLMPVILGVTVAFPMMYSAASAHNRSLSKELGEVCRICGANRRQTFTLFILPHAASAFPETLSSALSFEIKVVIAAEILMQTANGVGMMMSLAQIYLKTAELIAMTFAAVAVSIAFEYALRAALKNALSIYRAD